MSYIYIERINWKNLQFAKYYKEKIKTNVTQQSRVKLEINY